MTRSGIWPGLAIRNGRRRWAGHVRTRPLHRRIAAWHHGRGHRHLHHRSGSRRRRHHHRLRHHLHRLRHRLVDRWRRWRALHGHWDRDLLHNLDLLHHRLRDLHFALNWMLDEVRLFLVHRHFDILVLFLWPLDESLHRDFPHLYPRNPTVHFDDFRHFHDAVNDPNFRNLDDSRHDLPVNPHNLP